MIDRVCITYTTAPRLSASLIAATERLENTTPRNSSDSSHVKNRPVDANMLDG